MSLKVMTPATGSCSGLFQKVITKLKPVIFSKFLCDQVLVCVDVLILCSAWWMLLFCKLSVVPSIPRHFVIICSILAGVWIKHGHPGGLMFSLILPHNILIPTKVVLQFSMSCLCTLKSIFHSCSRPHFDKRFHG